VSGGMSQSAALLRLLADTLGVPLSVSTVPETASLGCAILAAVGAGAYRSLGEAIGAMTSARPVHPEPARRAECEERYRKWRAVYDQLQTWSL
jgi:sugar (pentulose or hexulose) kinase